VLSSPGESHDRPHYQRYAQTLSERLWGRDGQGCGQGALQLALDFLVAVFLLGALLVPEEVEPFIVVPALP
jgi:hypothetical protein